MTIQRTEARYTLAHMLRTHQAILFRKDSFDRKGFRLNRHETNPDAPLSPIYVNLRVLRSHRIALDWTVRVYRETIHALAFDALADVPAAATPLVTLLSLTLGKPMISPREAKGHGAGTVIDGHFTPGQGVLLVDDVATTGRSALAAARTLTANGLLVRDIVVLVDREEGAREELAKAGHTLHAAYTLTELLNFYRDRNRIAPEDYADVLAYQQVKP